MWRNEPWLLICVWAKRLRDQSLSQAALPVRSIRVRHFLQRIWTRELSRPSGTFVCGSRCLSDNGERILLQWAAIVSIWFYFGPDGPGQRARNRLVLDGSLLTSLYHLMSLLPLFHPCLVFSNVSSCFYTNDPNSWNNVASWLIKFSLIQIFYFNP